LCSWRETARLLLLLLPDFRRETKAALTIRDCPAYSDSQRHKSLKSRQKRHVESTGQPLRTASIGWERNKGKLHNVVPGLLGISRGSSGCLRFPARGIAVLRAARTWCTLAGFLVSEGSSGEAAGCRHVRGSLRRGGGGGVDRAKTLRTQLKKYSRGNRVVPKETLIVMI